MTDCGTPKDPIFSECEEECTAKVLFDESSTIDTSPTISVRGTPVRVVVSPSMPEGHLIIVERSYSEFGEFAGACQDDGLCPDMPWSPVECDACECGCGGDLYLFNVEDPSNTESRVSQNSIWLKETGEYRLVYAQGFNPPLAITVYAIEDCIPKHTANSMLNQCLPCPSECPPLEPVVELDNEPSDEEFVYCVDGANKRKPIQIPSICDLIDDIPPGTPVTIDEQNPTVNIIDPDNCEVRPATFEFPNTPICDLIDDIPSGTPVIIDEQNPTINVIDPDNCQVRPVTFDFPQVCCESVYPIATQQGGGICVEIGPTSTGQVVYQSRDGVFLEGTGTIGGNPPGALTISDTSPYDEPSLLVVVMRGVTRSFDIPGPYAYLDDESVTFRLGETLAIPRPSFYDNPLQTSVSQITEGPAVYVDFYPRYERGNTPGTMQFTKVLAPNESFTLYGQWWLTTHVNTVGGVYLYHGEMDVEGYILRGVTP